MKMVDIYTDGACSGNPGMGGWACILLYKDKKKILSGSEPLTTNNRMEMLAVINALKALNQSCIVSIYSDSAYVVNPFEKNWIEAWQSTNFKNGKLKNLDLWQELIEILKKHKYNFIKVKGHADNAYNNECDKLATGEIDKLRSSL